MGTSDEVFEQYRIELSTEKAVEALQLRGLAMFSGVHSDRDLIRFAESLGTVVQHRDSNKDGITAIRPTELDPNSGYDGFSHRQLLLHTDRSSMAEPPMILISLCTKPAAQGGESTFADARSVHSELSQIQPETVEALSRAGSAVFMGGQQPLFASVFEKSDGNRIFIRFRQDSFGYFSSGVVDHLLAMRRVLERHTIACRLQEGCGYILQNGWWLHGRKAFTGDRLVSRVLVQTPGASAGDIKFGFEPKLLRASAKVT